MTAAPAIGIDDGCTVVIGGLCERTRTWEAQEEAQWVVEMCGFPREAQEVEVWSRPTTSFARIRLPSWSAVQAVVARLRTLDIRSVHAERGKALRAMRARSKGEQDRTAPLARGVRALRSAAEGDPSCSWGFEAVYRPAGREAIWTSPTNWSKGRDATRPAWCGEMRSAHGT